MSSIHTIAVIGGTGRAGSAVAAQLLQRGFHVRLLARTPENVQTENPALTVIKGNALDREAITELLEHCDAVISTIGQRKGEPLNAAASTRFILESMEWYGIRRYVSIAGLTIDTPSDRKSAGTQALTDYMKQAFPETVADKQLAYELLAGSKVDWTLVRLPMIVVSDQRTVLKVDLLDCPGEQILTADLAAFLCDQLVSEQFLREAPFIASGAL